MPPATRGQTLRNSNKTSNQCQNAGGKKRTSVKSKNTVEAKEQTRNGSLKFRVTKVSKKYDKESKEKIAGVKKEAEPIQPPAAGKDATAIRTAILPYYSAENGETLQKAYAHLVAVDSRMKPLIERFPCTTFAADSITEIIEPFMGLSCSIISQQVSGAAASSIRRRFIELFNPGLPASVSSTEELNYFPSASVVAKTDITTLRSAGVSQRKAEYIQGLAEKFAAGELSKEMLAHAPYEEVLERLVAIRGIGQWTVEMFACFGLKRLDIFSVGDLAVQRGMAAFMGKDVARLQKKTGKWRYLSEAEMLEFAGNFAPYRSLFMWYMWRVVENISVDALKL